MLPGNYKIVETLTVTSEDSQDSVAGRVNRILLNAEEFWQPFGPVVCDGHDYMQTIVRLEKIPERRISQFRTVRVTGDFEKLAPYVQAAIDEGTGWQPFGPVATGSYVVKNELAVEYIQTLVKYE